MSPADVLIAARRVEQIVLDSSEWCEGRLNLYTPIGRRMTRPRLATCEACGRQGLAVSAKGRLRRHKVPR